MGPTVLGVGVEEKKEKKSSKSAWDMAYDFEVTGLQRQRKSPGLEIK